jgi:hypothetical protein
VARATQFAHITKMATSVDFKLLDKFVGRVLDEYKSGRMTKSRAIGHLGHLIGGLGVPEDRRSDPNRFMTNALAEMG